MANESDLKNTEKICRNCEHMREYTDKKGKKHFLCYQAGELNVFFFGPLRVSTQDTCKDFLYKATQNTH